MKPVGSSSKGIKTVIAWSITFTLAALSGLLAYSYVVAMNKTVKVPVAAMDIPPYTIIRPDQVTVLEIQKDTALKLTAGGDLVYKKAEDVIGKYAEVPIQAGEMFYKKKVSDPKTGRIVSSLYEKPGYRLVTIKASALNANAGQLKAGDYVDIYASSGDEGTSAYMLVSNVRITDIKYGANVFAETPKKQSDSSNANSPSMLEDSSSQQADLGNINPNIGSDEAYMILSLPKTKAEKVINAIMNGNELYFTARKPLIIDVNDMKSGKLIGSYVLYDYLLPSIDSRGAKEGALIREADASAAAEGEGQAAGQGQASSPQTGTAEPVSKYIKSHIDDWDGYVVYLLTQNDTTYHVNDASVDFDTFITSFETARGDMRIVVTVFDKDARITKPADVWIWTN